MNAEWIWIDGLDALNLQKSSQRSSKWCKWSYFQIMLSLFKKK